METDDRGTAVTQIDARDIDAAPATAD